jgi:hypothetical protein
VHPQAEQLAAAWINDFWSANREIEWIAVEEERSLLLDPRTLLIGKVDARGRTPDGEPFFGEWKTKSGSYAKKMADVKATWRMAPQALTYAVLNAADANRFTVRWALKTPVPQTDFEWYTYRPSELVHWHDQLRVIANGIRGFRQRGDMPWLTNFGNCQRYGMKYQCQHYAEGCGLLDFTKPTGPPRIPHTKLETLHSNPPNPDANFVVLSSSRVGDYLECPEKYRRNWEGAGCHEDNENLIIGSDFHLLVGQHLQSLIRGTT